MRDRSFVVYKGILGSKVRKCWFDFYLAFLHVYDSIYITCLFTLIMVDLA